MVAQMTNSAEFLVLVLRNLVDKGNTVLTIEHNTDFIACADYLIDLGPEGGERGGLVVAEGPPSLIIKSKDSFTARYLKKELESHSLISNY